MTAADRRGLRALQKWDAESARALTGTAGGLGLVNDVTMAAMTYAVRTLCLVLCLPIVVSAQANRPNNSPTQLESKAQSGDAVAQFTLGFRYDRAKNYDEALKWYRKAADQGLALAQSALGSMYEKGRGVSQDIPEALKWYRLAIQQDEPVAENNLGVMYLSGRGVTADLAQAKQLLTKSAEQGWPSGQSNLAMLYTASAAKDLVKAYMWCVLAAAGGQELCMGALEKMRLEMSPGAIEQGNSGALTWFEKRSERLKRNRPPWAGPFEEVPPEGDLALRLGTMYAAGHGVDKDESIAAKWYLLSAERGNSVAQARLGEMYFYGMGTPKDEARAFSWFQKSAAQGNAVGEAHLAFAYLQGVGVPKDSHAAVGWALKAAVEGNADAEALLGVCYQAGDGVAQSKAEAAKWFRKAADQGNVLAMNNLAWLYATEPALRNPAQAIKYASKAVELTQASQPQYLDTLAEAYNAAGDYDQAIQTEEKALRLQPENASLKQRLAKYKAASQVHSQH